MNDGHSTDESVPTTHPSLPTLSTIQDAEVEDTQRPVSPGADNVDNIADGVSETTALLDGRPPATTKFTFHQKVTFLSAVLSVFANMMAFSIISVFYPIEAKGRGLSQTVIGLVFSVFALSSGIASPIWGKILPLIGARFMFLTGAFVTGGCNILFGFVADMPTEATFTIFSFLIRVLEGLGSSSVFTSAYSIVAFTFPDNVGTALSLLEMSAGLSYALGPALGGWIYQAGGFKLPFFVLGGLVLVINAANFFILPDEQGGEIKETGSLLQVLSIPASWIALLAVALGAASVSSLEPTLAIHLKSLNFSIIGTSWMFVSLGFVYALASSLWGYIADKTKSTRIMLVLGAYGTAIFFLLLGPSPLLKLPASKLLIILSIPLGACSIAMVSMPTIVDMFCSAEWYGIPGNMGLTSVISGLWNGAFNLGTVIGPVLGSTLMDHFGYPYTTSVMATGCIVVMLIICLFGVWEFQCGKGRRQGRALGVSVT